MPIEWRHEESHALVLMIQSYLGGKVGNKILQIDTCDNCCWRARFSDHCLHNDNFNYSLDHAYPTPIPDCCPLQGVNNTSPAERGGEK